MVGIGVALAKYDPRKASFSTLVYDEIRKTVQEDIEVRTYRSKRDIRGVNKGRSQTGLATVELDAPVSGSRRGGSDNQNDAHPNTLGERLPSRTAINPEMAMIQREHELATKTYPARIQVALAKLPESERNLLLAVGINGVKQTELANREGVTKGHINHLVKHARETLRVLLQEEGIEI